MNGDTVTELQILLSLSIKKDRNYKMNTKNISALLIGKKTALVSRQKCHENKRFTICEYGFQAAKRIGIKNIFVSTDCPVISKIGSNYSEIN